MANAKQINIMGCVPFNVHEFSDIQPYLAYMAGPVSGLKITYSHVTKTVPNEYGGRTSFYGFGIEGVDSVSYAWLDGLQDAIRAMGGSIYRNSVVDVDN